MDRRKHVIIPEASSSKSCTHRRGDSPLKDPFKGRKGEMHRCPKCLKWWKRSANYEYLWYPVAFWDFKARRLIREFEEHERSQMHTIIGSDKIVEDR